MPAPPEGRDADMRVEEAWIPMPDGARLSATLYLPARGDGPWPPILEYLPYRKDDAMLARDRDLYAYMTQHGYAGVRVDIRGTGRSEGVLPEGEYSEVEQADGETAIAWLAAQPWSTGRVGMWGISWGGFNSIHLALRRPPALGAIIAVCASDDLFHDDVHYVDGTFHLDEYELMIDGLNAMTPSPEFPLDEDTLAARFDREPWLLEVLRHQRDGPFWRRGSLRPDYERLQVPTLLIGGWYDGYRDSVFRMLEAVPAPMRAIVGPWNHTFPHQATPGPEIEWRAEAARWFDRWLRDEDPGEDPRISVYVREWHPPDPHIETIPGRWRAERTWPPEGLQQRTLFPTADRSLGEDPSGEDEHALRYEPGIGVEVGGWWGEVTPDQAPLDERCLTYDSPPLQERVEIVGFPVTSLRVSADAPLANWFVRLCDVAPDGRSTLVTGAGRSGAQRNSSEEPEPIEPGVPFDLEVQLHATSWVFPKGHRIRLSISNALFPLAWPTRYPMTTTLHLGEPTRLSLPIPPPAALPEPSFAEPAPKIDDALARTSGDIEPTGWTPQRVGPTTVVLWSGASELGFDWGHQRYTERLTFRADDEDPAAASVEGATETTVRLRGRTLEWSTELRIESDHDSFHYDYRRSLSETGATIRERAWRESIPRDHQ